MTNEDLEEFIAQLRAKDYLTEPKPSWLGAKLKEQGTQRGLLLLAPLVLERYFQLDSPTAIQIVEGVIALYGTHNVVTEG